MTEDEYLTALGRVAVIWDAEAGTPEADELLRLVNAIQEYEADQEPVDDGR